MKYFIGVVFLAFFLINNQAQGLLQPCEIQARIAHGICFDPPGCKVLSIRDITGATPPYEYLWDNGHTGTSITYSASSGYPPVCHSVTITDALGCIIVLSDSLHHEDLTAGIVSDTILHGEVPLEFDLSANDSTGFVEYIIIQAPEHGHLSVAENGLAIFTPDPAWCGMDYFRYQARINCKYTPAVTSILRRTDCSAVLTNTNACNNECSGSAYLYSGEDLALPLTYQWPNNQTTDTVQNLCAGLYTLTITDAADQMHLYDFEIPVTQFNVSITGPSGVCKGEDIELTAEANIVGENPQTISYLWTGTGIGQEIAGTSITLRTRWANNGPNDYQLVATTQAGCTDSVLHSTIVHPRPSIETLPRHYLRHTPATLVLEPEFEGGTPPYQFLWTGPNGVYSDQPTLNWPGITPTNNGQFRFWLTDLNGCYSYRHKSYYFPDSLDSNVGVSIYEPNHSLCSESDFLFRFGAQGIYSSHPGFDSIRWTGPNGFYSNEHEFIFENLQPENSGTYYLDAFLGPYMVSDSMTIEVSPNQATVTNTTLIPITHPVIPQPVVLSL